MSTANKKDKNREEIAQRLKKVRKTLGFKSQADFVNGKLNGIVFDRLQLNIPRTTLAAIEAAKGPLTNSFASELDRIHGISATYLLFGSGPMIIETRSIEEFCQLPESVIDVRVIKAYHELTQNQGSIKKGETACSGMNDEPTDQLLDNKLYIVRLKDGSSNVCHLRKLENGDLIKIINKKEAGVLKADEVDGIWDVKFVIRKV